MSVATHQSNFGAGGVHSYELLSQRDSLPNANRYWGMLCYVLEENNKGTYQLEYNHYNNDISDNRNWVSIVPEKITYVLQSQTPVASLSSREIKSAMTGTLAQNASGDITIQGYKSYLLQSVETTHPAWVRIYGTPLARSADSSRTINEDPSASTQLLCEVVTDVSALKAQLSPGVLGYNYDDPVSSNIYLSVKNLDSSSHEITVNLSLVKLEA